MIEKTEDLAASNDTLMRLVNRYKGQITDLEIQIVKQEALIQSQQEVMNALRQEVATLRSQPDDAVATDAVEPNGKGTPPKPRKRT